jgi:hypothetical protein
MTMKDSLDKIITTYFATVTEVPFTYKGKTYEPKLVSISPMIYRDFICHFKCGACCSRFSLDYLPSEKKPYDLKKRKVEFNGNQITIWSDIQIDHDGHFCRNLNQQDGLCGIHGVHPFSCDFEILRFFHFKDRPDAIRTSLYGRGWQMLRIDGKRGAQCEMLEQSESGKSEALRKLKRLRQWANHFKLKTKVSKIIKVVEKANFDTIEQITL